MAGKEHNLLAIDALTWLENKATARGIRGALEVRVGNGYVADAAALCSLHSGFLDEYCKHSDLKPVTGCQRWDAKTQTAKSVYSGDVFNYFSCIFEAKDTRSDFLSTFGTNTPKHANRQEPIAALHWVVAQRFVVKPEELPDFWGLLVAGNRGLTEKRKPKIIIRSEHENDVFAHNLLWPLQARRNVCSKCGESMRRKYEDCFDDKDEKEQ